MPEKTSQQGERGSGFAHVKIPAAFVYPYTYPAMDGRLFDKAIVRLPQGTKVNGIDVGGYSCDVFMNDRMKQQMLAGEQPTLSFKGDEMVHIWKGDESYEVNPWVLVKGIKAEFDAFKTKKAAEREAAKEQGVSLKSEAEASREAAEALAGRDQQDVARSAERQ